MNIKTKYLCLLAVLSAVDVVIPIPILGVFLLYVVLERPLWFKDAVSAIYKVN
ncbi:MAG: hypothetical protein P1P89_14680 [Desulfobacterales bacterium]|nr:hypothetical protein [Desulfobacterales bacterium]